MTEAAVAEATFRAIGTTNRILATDAASLVAATDIAQQHLAEVDLALSRFRPDSEVSRLAARAQHGDTWAFASPTFAAYLRAALHAAAITGGLVDPTVGSAVAASGYDADMDTVRARTSTYAAYPAADPAADPTATRIPGWRSVTLDAATNRVHVPQGCLLDLGATAKAFAADTIARLLAERLPGGFLVNLGGDIAVSGTVPQEGWRIGVEDVEGRTRQVIVSTGQAITTSSTRHRTWTASDGTLRHHIVDPRTGRTAPAQWAQVSCVAANAFEANTASTAAIVLGTAATSWLAARGIPARLDALDGTVTFTAGWPRPESDRS